MAWYEEYDFVSNPFTIKPQEELEDFFGQKDIIDKIEDCYEEGAMIVVRGAYGTGKTTVMKGVIDLFKGERKVAYYNCYTSEKKIDFEDILVRGGNFLSSMFRMKTKDMILILDEAHNMMHKDFENVVDFFEDGYFRMVILVTSEDDFKFPAEINDIVGDQVYKLEMIDEKNAVELVKSRLEGVNLMGDDVIKKILKASKTPREFMMRCDDACRKAVERGSEKVEDKDLK
ncbi:AAA family ATPase [Candidatus Woesearchaeota archaeon]|nr:AAA family ATPase [Candidatus Woesearchaeota archaeon]